MIFSKSITFDGEEIGQGILSPLRIARSADEDLFIEKLKAGDADAFDVLVDRFSGEIFGLLYRLTNNAEESHDLTQETFLKALRSIKSFRAEAELKTWLCRIAINESRNRFRWWKRRRRDVTISLDETVGNTELTFSETLSDPSISPEDEALRRERGVLIKAALDEVPEAYREAVILCDIEGLSYDETAEVLGIGLGTVKSLISRGREELRRRLKDF
jgi:RNA polymerase sigma-70 factor (ECF subfamily)